MGWDRGSRETAGEGRQAPWSPRAEKGRDGVSDAESTILKSAGPYSGPYSAPILTYSGLFWQGSTSPLGRAPVAICHWLGSYSAHFCDKGGTLSGREALEYAPLRPLEGLCDQGRYLWRTGSSASRS